jgi:hypothetical protein
MNTQKASVECCHWLQPTMLPMCVSQDADSVDADRRENGLICTLAEADSPLPHVHAWPAGTINSVLGHQKSECEPISTCCRR